MQLLARRGARAWIYGSLAGALLCGVSTATLAADPRDAEMEALRSQLTQIAQRLEALEQAKSSGTEIIELKSATDANTAAISKLTSPPAAAVTLKNGRPTFATADDRFTASLRGVAMIDSGLYLQDEPGPITSDFRRGGGAGDTARARDLNDGVVLRRARLGIEGKLFGEFDYNFLTEFGGSGTEDAAHIHELWLQYTGFKPFRLRVGAFEPQVSLGANVSTTGIPILERPSPAEVARNLAAGDARLAAQLSANGTLGKTDAGFSAFWMAAGAVTGSSVATINANGSGAAQAFGEQLGFTGRLGLAPFTGPDLLFHAGLNGSFVPRPADTGGPDTTGVRTPVQFRDRPELRVDATRLVDTGAIDADSAYTAGLELAAQYKSFLIQGEYFRYGIERRNSLLADPRFSGWYVEAVFGLTGDRRKYNPINAVFDAPAPVNSFNREAGTYGALELAARYSDLDLNYHAGSAGTDPAADAVRGGEQKIWTLGLNWYPNAAVKLMFDVQHVDVDRLSPSATAFVTPSGAQVGQDYNAVAVRTQYAF